MRHWRELQGILVLFVALASPMYFALIPASADPVAELSVQTSANILRAGSNNTIAMTIQGIGKLLSNLDVSLTLQQPLVLFGDNHWRRNSFGPGNSLSIPLTIFAPSSTAGNSYEATLTAEYKEAGETTYSEETHTIGLLVRGWIDLVIYDITVTPAPAGPGSALTISGSLLNRGVTAAMFTNLTIKPESPLIVASEGVSYMGEVDPNAPAPFSLSALIESTTQDGRYDATLIVAYQDDLHMNQQIMTSVSFEVSSAVTQTRTTSGPSGPIGSILSYSQYLFGLLVLVVVLLIVRKVRKRRAKESAT